MFANKITKKLSGYEHAAGDISADSWAIAIVKVACILIIGIVILNGVTGAANMTANSTFYSLMTTVKSNITSGYTLAGLMILALGASAVMHFLGFV